MLLIIRRTMMTILKILDAKIDEWDKKMEKVKGERQIVFFHSSWIYFADQYGIKDSRDMWNRSRGSLLHPRTMLRLLTSLKRAG